MQSLILQSETSSHKLLKKWQDEVLTYGWAYGSSGNALKEKKMAVAVAADIWEEDCQPSGRYLYTLEEILRPFEMTVSYIKAQYHPYFALFGTEPKSDSGEELTNQRISTSADQYLTYLRSL